jgi:hypothetical protein
MEDNSQIPLELQLYYSFANVFDARCEVQQENYPDIEELKAVEDRLWRLFIRSAYRNICPTRLKDF